ncbi:SRPBCC family protein [Kineosporia rhizophila]|uniref:SRPBCC family protein n=1 Tax=Kineosporia rhizophila TaxID=84633 RepID=UPI000A7237B1|nr:SRPBCC family protein [Kineosporia rhizophila]
MDIAAAAGLVVREVRNGTREGVPTKVSVARRTYATDRADLWDVLTNAERIPRWFLPVSGDLKVGGHYQLEGNAGGTVERCEAPEFFALTWEFGEMTSWVRVRLAEAPEGATLELEHEAVVPQELWDQFGPGATGVGWDGALYGLGAYLDTGASMDPAEAALWGTTPEGKTFMRLCADGWAEAAIASGDAPEAARAAADRTFGFYTGTSEDSSES